MNAAAGRPPVECMGISGSSMRQPWRRIRDIGVAGVVSVRVAKEHSGIRTVVVQGMSAGWKVGYARVMVTDERCAMQMTMKAIAGSRLVAG